MSDDKPPTPPAKTPPVISLSERRKKLQSSKAVPEHVSKHVDRLLEILTEVEPRLKGFMFVALSSNVKEGEGDNADVLITEGIMEDDIVWMVYKLRETINVDFEMCL